MLVSSDITTPYSLALWLIIGMFEILAGSGITIHPFKLSNWVLHIWNINEQWYHHSLFFNSSTYYWYVWNVNKQWHHHSLFFNSPIEHCTLEVSVSSNIITSYSLTICLIIGLFAILISTDITIHPSLTLQLSIAYL